MVALEILKGTTEEADMSVVVFAEKMWPDSKMFKPRGEFSKRKPAKPGAVAGSVLSEMRKYGLLDRNQSEKTTSYYITSLGLKLIERYKLTGEVPQLY